LHLADIGAGFNLSKTQVCQIHAEVVNALRKYMCSVWFERDRNEARPELIKKKMHSTMAQYVDEFAIALSKNKIDN